MKIIRSVKKMSKLSDGWHKKGMSVGFVPTLGALHKAHASLIKRARRDNRICVVSIFVNPAQFGPGEDYKRYPRPVREDVRLLKGLKADVLFMPEVKDVYPAGYDTYVECPGLSKFLCGAKRPGHFRGVATIVTKLLNIVRPTRAYFGRKDYQQLKVIQRLVKDLNMNVSIIPCSIVRERDGLAVSSRNVYLSCEERRRAAAINRALRRGRDVIKSRKCLTADKVIGVIKRELNDIPNKRIDYVSVVHSESLFPVKHIKLPVVIAAAVWVGKARLIDNLYVK